MFKVTFNVGKFDEDSGYSGTPTVIDSFPTEAEALESAKSVSRDSTRVPIHEGFTVRVGEYEGDALVREVRFVHFHPHGMTDDQRQNAKRNRLKSLNYEPVKASGKPLEGKVYYFADGALIDEKDKDEKHGKKGMLGRVGSEYFVKYYE